ncbi:Uncharacterised protein [Mycobacterium xenopi]|uniref:Uncharacterized protein n=1 Tax=Mycobacterium xenopi TaxID=1789 RepID=A0AAD1H4X5_MYCXE|nr:hypothetical protein MYXE_40900 [Mycobacterium xenopi]SPX90396.1 Uncharacterised protein [Mycobacterium xenopi]
MFSAATSQSGFWVTCRLQMSLSVAHRAKASRTLALEKSGIHGTRCGDVTLTRSFDCVQLSSFSKTLLISFDRANFVTCGVRLTVMGGSETTELNSASLTLQNSVRLSFAVAQSSSEGHAV